MSVFDVTKDQGVVTEIQYVPNSDYNLIMGLDGVYLKQIRIEDMTHRSIAFIGSKQVAENLIKAIQKTIDLGWVK